MLESVKITRRQSEIRQALAGLVGKATPTEDETRQIETLDGEFRNNEVRYRGALIAEDTERRDAKGELETRGDREYSDLIGKFEVRQAVLALDEGRALSGPTAEIVSELRERGGFRGIPIPLLALERRSGETVASGVFDPKNTRPVIDRLFPQSVSARMGGQLISIDSGAVEWPVVSSSIAAGWQATETGAVAGPTVFSTVDKALTPASTLGIQVKVTRKSLKQSGDALEQAIRRDLSGAIESKLDAAAFLGAGSSGEPLGIIPGYSTYGITLTDLLAAAQWSQFRAAIARFMAANAAGGPGAVKLLVRPEVWSKMDGALITDTSVSEWDRLIKNVPMQNIVMSANALAAPTPSPDTGATNAVLTTSAGVAPFFMGIFGGVDLIRDPYSDASSGGLRLTALVTADVTVARGAQLQILTNLNTV